MDIQRSRVFTIPLLQLLQRHPHRLPRLVGGADPGPLCEGDQQTRPRKMQTDLSHVLAVSKCDHYNVHIMDNVRSINDDPVVDNHLCLADPASIAFPDDLVMREQYAFDKDIGDYNILQYGLTDRNTDRHRWYYFPGITRQQAILHKQYDSDPSVPGRFCFHAASPDPEAPKNIPARASMEVRGLCFFPDDQKK